MCGGTQADPCGWRSSQGSIPACAGEPCIEVSFSSLFSRVYPRVCGGTFITRRTFQRIARVYPRVCGGTSCPISFLRLASGLSPRVRGNLGCAFYSSSPRVRGNLPGSIPACAGEPLRFSLRASLDRVYPRVCGGTDLWRRFKASALGLSPRVRGNLSCNG